MHAKMEMMPWKKNTARLLQKDDTCTRNDSDGFEGQGRVFHLHLLPSAHRKIRDRAIHAAPTGKNHHHFLFDQQTPADRLLMAMQKRGVVGIPSATIPYQAAYLLPAFQPMFQGTSR